MNQPPCVGIIGGGQLGKMLTIAAKKLGFFVIVIDPTPQSPAGQVADKQIIADFKDEKAIEELSFESEYITFEIELANDKVLYKIMEEGKQVNPHPKTLSIIRDKLKQKIFLKENKIPTAEFTEIPDNPTEENINKFGYPILLKAREGAYDGRGNFLIKKKSDINKGFEKLKGRKLYIEKFVPFIKELAVMVARGKNGEIKSYPTVETIHKDNICDTVIAPARVSKALQEKAKKLAEKTVSYLQGRGVFGIEMFLTKDNKILINEIAPRVHNSGHYSIEASVTSQFEQHIRAVCGLPLGSTDIITKAVVMKNILGKNHGNGFPRGIEKALLIPGVSLHIYGKRESRPQRKMGHITVVGNSVDECLRKANQARKMLTI